MKRLLIIGIFITGLQVQAGGDNLLPLIVGTLQLHNTLNEPVSYQLHMVLNGFVPKNPGIRFKNNTINLNGTIPAKAVQKMNSSSGINVGAGDMWSTPVDITLQRKNKPAEHFVLVEDILGTHNIVLSNGALQLVKNGEEEKVRAEGERAEGEPYASLPEEIEGQPSVAAQHNIIGLQQLPVVKPTVVMASQRQPSSIVISGQPQQQMIRPIVVVAPNRQPRFIKITTSQVSTAQAANPHNQLATTQAEFKQLRTQFGLNTTPQEMAQVRKTRGAQGSQQQMNSVRSQLNKLLAQPTLTDNDVTQIKVLTNQLARLNPARWPQPQDYLALLQLRA